MARVHLRASSQKRFEHFRQHLDSALDNVSGAHLLSRTWDDQVLYLSAPGTEAFVRFHYGNIQAEIDISFPATLMKQQIIQEIRNLLAVSGAEAVEITEP